MIRYPGLPAAPAGPMHTFLSAVKETLELLTGARGKQPVTLPSYPVEDLPPNSAGDLIYVTNARKAGEAAGQGSGIMAISDKTKWCACDTGLAVQK